MSLFNFNPLELRPRRPIHESEENIMENIKPTPIVNNRSGCFNRTNAWRLTSALMGLFFLLAAAVQHNDPDPYLWMPAYIVPCIISWTVTLAYAHLIELDEHACRNGSGNNNPQSTQPLTPTWITLLLAKLDTVILLHILYCFSLGIWTLVTCTLLAHDDLELMSNWKNPNENLRMAVIQMNDEEAKELLGLCLIIAWLALLKNRNFIHLGIIGIGLGILLTLTPFLSWILVAIMENDMMSSCGKN